MSLPATESWFSLTVRRNRKSFAIAYSLLLVIMLAIFVLMYGYDVNKDARELILLACFIPYLICTYFLTAQRLRDIGVAGWLALLWIPVTIADSILFGAASVVFLVILLSVPGTNGRNRYGTDPLAPGASRHNPIMEYVQKLERTFFPNRRSWRPSTRR
jgi:uncharacterized membrane protein YhaH (DUF805 family)